MAYNNHNAGENSISKLNKEALQVSKEIVVKFIEVQRISPSNFSEIFPEIYQVVLQTLREGQKSGTPKKSLDREPIHHSMEK